MLAPIGSPGLADRYVVGGSVGGGSVGRRHRPVGERPARRGAPRRCRRGAPVPGVTGAAPGSIQRLRRRRDESPLEGVRSGRYACDS